MEKRLKEIIDRYNMAQKHGARSYVVNKLYKELADSLLKLKSRNIDLYYKSICSVSRWHSLEISDKAYENLHRAARLGFPLAVNLIKNNTDTTQYSLTSNAYHVWTNRILGIRKNKALVFALCAAWKILPIFEKEGDSSKIPRQSLISLSKWLVNQNEENRLLCKNFGEKAILMGNDIVDGAMSQAALAAGGAAASVDSETDDIACYSVAEVARDACLAHEEDYPEESIVPEITTILAKIILEYPLSKVLPYIGSKE